ncbi:MAG TPA: hypothetical protein VGH07_07770, partial [Chthoniobacterales bacterium]
LAWAGAHHQGVRVRCTSLVNGSSFVQKSLKNNTRGTRMLLCLATPWAAIAKQACHQNILIICCSNEKFLVNTALAHIRRRGHRSIRVPRVFFYLAWPGAHHHGVRVRCTSLVNGSSFVEKSLKNNTRGTRMLPCMATL